MLPEIKTILYATDLEEKGSKNAFRWAVAMGEAHKAQLIMLHAIEPMPSSAEILIRNELSGEELREFEKRGLENLQEQLQKRIDAFCMEECPNEDQSYAGGAPIALVKSGSPDQVILNTAKKYDADLIVMGTRTHSGIGQLLGSTANKVIHHSDIPVTIYPL